VTGLVVGLLLSKLHAYLLMDVFMKPAVFKHLDEYSKKQDMAEILRHKTIT
jgi:hypothetical protein